MNGKDLAKFKAIPYLRVPVRKEEIHTRVNLSGTGWFEIEREAIHDGKQDIARIEDYISPARNRSDALWP
jgi:hypothetical protein